MAPTKKSDLTTGSNLLNEGLPRRNFLKYVAAAFGTAMLPDVLDACAPKGADLLGSTRAELAGAAVFSPSIYVTRPTDLVSLGFQFSNLASTSGTLKAVAAGPAYIAVTFPPQHIIEQPYAPPSGAGPFATPFSDSYAAGPSTLVFQLPATYGTAALPSVPYTLEKVLDLCAQCTLVVAPNALSTAGASVSSALVRADEEAPGDLASARVDRLLGSRDPAASKRASRRQARIAAVKGRSPEVVAAATVGAAPAPPAPGQTSLEIPYRIQMSPSEQAAWILSGLPVTSPVGGRTELWSARMARRNAITGLADPTLGGLTARPLWTRDNNAGEGAPPFDVSSPPTPLVNLIPAPADRKNLVEDAGDLTLPASVASPLQVGRLILTALGATLDIAGDFSDPNLLSYQQNIALGRDVFVKASKTGYLFPFGHTAVFTELCVRNTDPTVGAIGTLYEWGVLTIRNPLVAYDQTNPLSRRFPFAGVELVDGSIKCAAATGAGGWVNGPQAGASALRVGAVGYDKRGRAIKFTTPLMFVPESASAATMTSFANGWNGGGDGGQGYSFDGQRIAYATPTSGKDDTSYETVSCGIILEVPSSPSATIGSFLPIAQGLVLNVEAIRHLTGNQNAGATFNYHPTFIASGFGAGNPNEAILTVSSATKPALTFSQPQAPAGSTQPGGFGGFVAPDMSISGLSRKLGPLSGTAAGSATGNFDPLDFFGSTTGDIFLFGAIPLTSILQTVTSAAAPYMPKIVTQELANAEHFLQEVEAVYDLIQNGITVVANLYTQAQADLAAANALLAGSPSASDRTKLTALVASTLTPAVTNLGELVTIAAGGAITAAGLLETAWTQAQTVWTDVTSFTSGSSSALTALTSLIGENGAGGDVTTLLGTLGQLLSTTGLGGAGIVTYAGGLINDLSIAVSTVQSFFTTVEGAASAAVTLFDDLQNLAQGLELAKDLTVQMTWRPKLQGLISETSGVFQPSNDQALSLAVTVRGKATPTQPAGADMTIRLDQFALGFGLPPASTMPANTTNAIPWVTQNAYVSLVFDHIQLQMLAGAKPDVDVVFKGIYFGGPLQFIETLKDILPLDGFSDPPFLDIESDHIDAGFSLSVPNVAIGMFSLENISITADLALYFISNGSNALTFSFDFCTKDQPFLVTVAMLGGGGYFSMTMNPSGLTHVEAAIEVCAQLALDLGVAAGCVSIEVGVYFSYATGTGIELSGYLRIRGEVDVLGIITISVELYMSLTYYSQSGKVVGYAEISVEIDIAFFSKTVSISYQRQFAGSNGDPTFADVMLLSEGYGPNATPLADAFRDYCIAYAA